VHRGSAGSLSHLGRGNSACAECASSVRSPPQEQRVSLLLKGRAKMDETRSGVWRTFLVLAVVALSCGKPDSVAPRREALISDQRHDTAGTQGFFFLAPIVPDAPRAFTGVFEPRLDPVVRIDRIDPLTGATIAPVASLTSETSEK